MKIKFATDTTGYAPGHPPGSGMLRTRRRSLAVGFYGVDYGAGRGIDRGIQGPSYGLFSLPNVFADYGITSTELL